MDSPLNREELRRTLAGFDERRKKIIGALLAVMFRDASRVRDREWIAEQFTEVALLAGQFESPEALQGWVRENIHPILNSSYALFAVVGEDLASRAATGFTHAEAMFAALSYFDASGEDVEGEAEGDSPPRDR
jgi:hypothetical protein